MEYNDGYKGWRKNGQLHREDGPAIEWGFGKQEWCLFDKEYLCQLPSPS